MEVKTPRVWSPMSLREQESKVKTVQGKEGRTIKEDTSVEMRGKSFSSRQLPDSDLCYQGGHLGDALTLGAGINVPDFYVCCIFPCREESLE